MPKRQKKGTKESEYERRPPEVTLADFITTRIPQKSRQNQTISDKPESSTGKEENTSIVSATVSGNTTVSVISQPENNADKDKAVFYICRTKKGGYPIQVESRSRGKKVTVIEHVYGDPRLLLQDFKSKFGTGGLIKENRIEIQGNFISQASKYLDEHKGLLRPYDCIPPET